MHKKSRTPKATFGKRRKGVLALAVSCFLVGQTIAGIANAADSNTGTWGDRGDGTFRNPMLNADYPDVDIERVGDAYYMITSTNHYAPGMTILESRDMLNWKIIGHVWDKLTWDPKYNWDKMDGYKVGVWAGDLAYHDGTWFCYQIDFSLGLYVSTAKKITGPWTEPVCMLKKSHWTDPAAFWDEEEKQAYLIVNFGLDPEVKDERVNQSRMFKMSWDGMKLLDEGAPVYRAPGAEAAKIYKKDGYYYIFLAEWRNNDRKQIVLRGKSLYPPFERKVVMERGEGMVRSTCQGALVQVPDGSWWLTHQLVQNRGKVKGDMPGATTPSSYEGRSQWLVPVTWEKGWPVVGSDPDGNDIGNTIQRARKPIKGFPVTAPQTDDEFDFPELGHQWNWNHNPRDSHWSLTERPGWLRLKAGVPVGEGGFWKAANTISQRIMGKGKGRVTARVNIKGMRPGQQAGFCHHSGQYILLGIRVEENGTRRLVFNNNGKEEKGPAIKSALIYYRTDIDGDRATFSYSTDGKNCKPFGAKVQLKFGNWRGDRLGFYCWNDVKEAGSIDVDWFRYDYDGPKGE